MTSLKVHYADQEVGNALVDHSLDDLSKELMWRLEVPKTLRRDCQGRKDIILAMLREDPDALARCHPYVWIKSKIPLRLSRVALRPELMPLLNEVAAGRISNDLLDTIRKISGQVKEVVFLNQVRTDCRSENLREVI